MAGGDGREHGAATGAADVQVARCQAGYESRRAANENWLGVDAVLGQDTLLVSDP